MVRLKELEGNQCEKNSALEYSNNLLSVWNHVIRNLETTLLLKVEVTENKLFGNSEFSQYDFVCSAKSHTIKRKLS